MKQNALKSATAVMTSNSKLFFFIIINALIGFLDQMLSSIYEKKVVEDITGNK